MSSAVADPLIAMAAKIRARHELTDDDLAALTRCMGEVVDWPADHTLIRQGEWLEQSTLLLDGLLGRSKETEAGRQIMEIHVPGDLPDLHSFLLKRLDSDIVALTPVRIVTLSHEKLADIVAERPRLTRVLWFLTCLDAAISREWEVSLGRRDAKARLAHLLCELDARLGVIGRSEADGFDLPLTQGQMAECLGLTSVHVSRVARQLREDGLAVLRRGRVEITDRDRLARMGQWTPDYLYLNGPLFK